VGQDGFTEESLSAIKGVKVRRMRRWGGILCASGVILSLVHYGAAAAPKEVGKRKLQWSAVPGFGTPYFPIGSTQAACDKEPTAQGVTGPTGLPVPAPPGTWSDILVKVPAKVAGRVPIILSATIFNPTGNWDLFICKVVKGKYVFASFDVPSVPCPPPGIGCTQNPKTTVKPGQTLVLRAYNFFDVNTTATGSLSYLAR
jgi:hypothetical protein